MRIIYETILTKEPTCLADSPHPSSKRARFLIRARGTIHDNADPLLTHRSHCSALAYISDSYFIGTVPRAHGLIRLSTPSIKSVAASHPPKQSSAIKEWTVVEEAENAAAIQAGGELAKDRREVGMMVSLDHTIYFHNPRRFRADEWLVAEMETPWAGDGRGLVLQKMWTTDGVLVASCVQEVSRSLSLPCIQRSKRENDESLTRTLNRALCDSRRNHQRVNSNAFQIHLQQSAGKLAS